MITPICDLVSIFELNACSFGGRGSSNSKKVLYALDGVPLKKIIIHPAISKTKPADDSIC